MATYDIDKLTLPNGDVCNLFGGNRTVAGSLTTTGNLTVPGAGLFGNSTETQTMLQLSNSQGAISLHKNAEYRGIYDSAAAKWLMCYNGLFAFTEFPFRCPVEDITSQVTYDTTRLTTPTTFTVKRCGNVVQVFIGNFNAINTGNNQLGVLSYLPTAATQMNVYPGGTDAANNANIFNAGNAFWINPSGTTLNMHIGTTSYAMWMAFTYITSDY